jgi:hypothetical protein
MDLKVDVEKSLALMVVSSKEHVKVNFYVPYEEMLIIRCTSWLGQ